MSTRDDRLYRLGYAAGDWDGRHSRLDRPDRYPAGNCRKGYRNAYEMASRCWIRRVDVGSHYRNRSLEFYVGGDFGPDAFSCTVFVRRGRWHCDLPVRRYSSSVPLVTAYVRRLWQSQPVHFQGLVLAVLEKHGLARPVTYGENPLLKDPDGAAFRDYLDETGHPLLDYYINAWAWHRLWPLLPRPSLTADHILVADAFLDMRNLGWRHWAHHVFGVGLVSPCRQSPQGWLTEGDQVIDRPDYNPCPYCYSCRPMPYPALAGVNP